MAIYNFPNDNLMIEAESLHEANEKRIELLKPKKIENASNKSMAKSEKSNKSLK